MTGSRGPGVRRGQLIMPFGVGAIVEVGQDSFVCAELSRWALAETVALDPSELQSITGREIRVPHGAAPFVRFPRWLFCPDCRRMQRLTPGRERELLEKNITTPKCTECWKDMAPMGFVQACSNGHLDEVDWFRWAHRNAQVAGTGQCARGTSVLRFTTSGARGGDWETLWIDCETCGAKNNLRGLTTSPLPWKCRGRQPWMSQDGPACDQPAFGHRRGDSNLYFPDSLSAIDVVVDGAMPSTGLRKFVADQFVSGAWKGMRDAFLTFGARDMAERIRQQLSDLATSRGVGLQEVEEAFISELEGAPLPADERARSRSADQDEILKREWPVLSRNSDHESDSLIIRVRAPGASWPVGLRDAVHRVSLIPRLREVRALLSFRRIDSSGSLQPLHATNPNHWLPGAEVWGEGIFIQFSESFVSLWEQGLVPELRARVADLARRYEASGKPGVRVSPRFVALHTLSHAVLRRLAFDAGYSSTALRERIYAGPGMAGVLIYTADGDSEGSLGGLVRMGDPRLLVRTLTSALHDASWCSADPVCGETPLQGVGGLNGAACHACTLVSETSCTYHNQLLDRHFLLNCGDPRMAAGLLALPPLAPG